MRCAWESFLGILPQRLRPEVDALGKEALQELRLRQGSPPELVFAGGQQRLNDVVRQEDLRFLVNAASQYSPWTAATMAQGYITAAGGHRIGLCGEAICKDGSVIGLRQVHSACIRIARDYPGIGKRAAKEPGSMLILGAPGWGKTTLLRDLIRQISAREAVCVIDERGELFPEGFDRGSRTDVLANCPKPAGMEMALRTMGPQAIALDEITGEEDCEALIRVANCGVRLLATAHAMNRTDLQQRPVYQRLLQHKVFRTLLLLSGDKSYTVERMTP